MNVPKKNRLEWAVFAVSLLLVLSMAGSLVHQAVTTSEGPPLLTAFPGPPTAYQEGYLVPVTVRNDGDSTVQTVSVKAVLHPPSGEPEEAGFEIGFLPLKSERRGWAFFTSDPKAAGARIELTVEGAGEP